VPLNYVTLTLDLYDGQGNPVTSGIASFAPSVQLTDTTDHELIAQAPVPCVFHSGGLPTVKLLATDNGAPLPLGWGWTVTFSGVPGNPAGFTFFLPYASGASQYLSAQAPVSTAVTQFPANPMTTLGDIIYGLATGTPARLAGNTTAAKEFLAQTGTGSVSAAPAWAAIAAGDLPTGTTSAQGALQLDGAAADIQPPGVGAAGAKGQAADAKHVHPLQPWQFMPEAYGAKRNGAFLYDAAITSSSAILTTAGLPAPSAPTVGNSGSGGTVLAGTYQVKITYVNQYGETLASTGTSTTTSGSASKITVSSPAPWTNATGYYVYCTQAGGSTYTRQQGAGSPTPLRSSYVITAPPTSSGAAPPGANTSNSAPFTAGDVGKNIVVPSAGGFTNVPLCTTIASYQSATQVTLAATASSTVTGSGAVYGTDDTAAIQSAINAAVAYAQTAGSERAIGEVVFSAGIYCVAGAPGGTYQSAQIQIPYIDPYAGPRVNLRLTGPQEAGGPVHWEQPNPPAAGATLASMVYSDSGSGAGPPPNCVIGAPVQGGGVFFGGNGGLFSNMRVTVDGINILVPFRCSYAGLDLFGVGQTDMKSYGYYAMARTLGAAAGGWPPYISGASNPSPWGVFGYRAPATGNNDRTTVDRMTVYGPYYGFIFTDHFSADTIECIFCYCAAAADPQGTAHHCSIRSLSSEATSVPLVALSGTVAVSIGSLHIENADTIISDPGNNLYGEVRAEMISLTGAFSTGKNGGANIRLIWDYQPIGVVASPPSVPATTVALRNTFWRDATVYLTSGGAAVSAIAVDGTTTGLTLGTSGTVMVRVPSGHTITLTYASAAPTWMWVLE
jgi:hypothetical protein